MPFCAQWKSILLAKGVQDVSSCGGAIHMGIFRSLGLCFIKFPVLLRLGQHLFVASLAIHYSVQDITSEEPISLFLCGVLRLNILKFRQDLNFIKILRSVGHWKDKLLRKRYHLDETIGPG